MLIYLALSVFTTAIGGMLFGYDIGVINGVLVMGPFRDTFNWQTKFEEGFIVSSLQLGCFIGCLIAAFLCDSLGRKRSILGGAVLFCTGGAIQTASSTLGVLYLGRIIAGLAIGMLSMAVPLYLSEISPKQLRGRLISTYQLAITIGILVSFLINLACSTIQSNNSWRVPFAIQVVISAMMAISMIFLPASPRWLASRGRCIEAETALVKVRGGDSPDVQHELHDINESISLQREIGDGSWSELFVGGMWRRLGIGVLLQAFQQLTGINAIMYYAPQILSKAGFTGLQVLLIATAGTGIVNVLMTLPGIFLVDRLGRKPMLLIGSAGIAATMAILGAMIGAYGPNFANHAAPYVCLAMMYIFTASFAATWGPIGWIIPAEIYPLRIRAKAMAITTASNWLFNFIVAQVVPELMASINWGLYLIFAAFGVIMGVWVLFILPETKGKSLEEIDRIFGQEGLTDAREATLKETMVAGGH